MSVYGHGPTVREQMIIDLTERGIDAAGIAERLGLSEGYVRQVAQALVAPPVGAWEAGARKGTANLLAALRRHHPQRCGGEA